MTRISPKIGFVFMLAALQGCANFTHFNEETELAGGGSAMFVDAKQRVITYQRRPGSTATDPSVVCAEPSPDALSSIAAQAGGTFSKGDDLSAALNTSLAEGVGSIGLRTQSIQMMRDAMYRLCEGYQSGALPGLAFETLHRRLQSSMVAILAIEQLTGTVRAPAIVLGSTAAAANADTLVKITAQAEAAREAATAADDAVTQRTAEMATANTARAALDTQVKALTQDSAATPANKVANDAKIKDIQDKQIPLADAAVKKASDALANAVATAAQRKQLVARLEEARRAALVAGGSSSVAGSIEVVGSNQRDMAQVAESVQKIVEKTLELSYSRDLCTTLLTTSVAADVTRQPVINACLEFLKKSVEDDGVLLR